MSDWPWWAWLLLYLFTIVVIVRAVAFGAGPLPLFEIVFSCPRCGHAWGTTDSVVSNGKCPVCKQKNVAPLEFSELKKDSTC